MVTKSSDVWNAILADVHYAGGGNSGAALSETVLVQGTDTMAAVDDQITVTYPTAIPAREAQKGLGAGLYPNKMDTVKLSPGTGIINSWLQTDDWFDLAISGTFGALMTTFTWHTDNGEEEVDHFGCWVEKLVITLEKGKPSLQEVTIRSRSWSVAGAAMTKVAFQSGAKGYSQNSSATIDALTSVNLVVNKIVITIMNAIEEEKGYGLGDNSIQKPLLLSRDVTVAVDHLEEASNTWAADARHETAQLVDITVVCHTTLTATMANLVVKSTNTDDNEHGIKLHSVLFESGVGFTIA